MQSPEAGEEGSPGGGSETAAAVKLIGRRIRTLRSERGLSLQEVGRLAGVSASLLSLVERGKAAPSIGTLVAVAAALSVPLSDLIEERRDSGGSPVRRCRDQPVFLDGRGIERRVVIEDRREGFRLIENLYLPGASTTDDAISHPGLERGLVTEGELTVTIEGVAYRMFRGDVVSIEAVRPHRIANETSTPAVALWFSFGSE